MNNAVIEKISIVVPVYNEEESLAVFIPYLMEELDKIKKTMDIQSEVMLIDDGSTDSSYKILKDFAGKYAVIKIIHFGTNFGQTAALSAGFQNASGEVIVTLDADGQNDPADIKSLLEKLQEGYDVVSGWRKDRKDKFLSRILPSRTANYLISVITGLKLHDYGCTLKAYRKESVKHLNLYGEMHRFIPSLLKWSGASITEIHVKHHPRKKGTSKYGISRTIKVLLDLAVVKFLMSFSTRPIQFFGIIALIILFISVISFAGVLYYKYYDNLSMNRNPLLYFSLTSFMISIQLFILGFIAEMLARTYHESQHKPIYVIKETINFDEKD
ncbi:MAG: glycosyl transferase [Candidatus Fischerbacteria bacterium RBG_13_37_8]|uniref:Glycosyl transferase n=1 Tax=Candidatus Fischerbacteria bacterium RBG_13_37_8 TaxID=1817863 RepID=A0A1F5VKT5_9BACT|nr:MAG: glycosyl transferase [Candidatus Fischerbacteria bacterium RBG_13_37_8]